MCLSIDDHLSLDVEGNACDSCSQRSIQDASVNHAGHSDGMKRNCDNNSLQQEMYCGKMIDKENFFSAACQTNDREDNSVIRKDKSTSAKSINKSLSNMNESKSCINVSHEDKQRASLNTSTYSV